MAKNRRVLAAPRFQLSYETSMLYKGLSDKSKDKVWRAFHNWISDARKRGADYMNMEPITSTLDEAETDTLTVMIENVRAGWNGYWSRAKDDADNTSDNPTQQESVPDSLRQAQTDNQTSNHTNIHPPIHNRSTPKTMPGASRYALQRPNNQQVTGDPIDDTALFHGGSEHG